MKRNCRKIDMIDHKNIHSFFLIIKKSHHEEEQRHLVDNTRGEVELELEAQVDPGRRLVGEEGGVAHHPGGVGGLAHLHLLLTDTPTPSYTE